MSMKSVADQVTVGIFGVITLGVLLVAGCVVEGFVFSALWRWFVSEPFGVQGIGIAHAVGLALLVGWLTRQHIKEPKETKEEATWELAFRAIGRPAIVLGVGAIVHQVMQ
jgi:hypothetical protein